MIELFSPLCSLEEPWQLLHTSWHEAAAWREGWQVTYWLAQFNKNILTRQEKGGFKSEPHFHLWNLGYRYMYMICFTNQIVHICTVLYQLTACFDVLASSLVTSRQDNHIPRFWNTGEVTDEWVTPQQHVVHGRVGAVLQLNSILDLENTHHQHSCIYTYVRNLSCVIMCSV